MTLVWIVVAGVVLVFVAQGWTQLELARLRRTGQYPQKGQATLEDVRRLKSAGLSVWAIRCYRELHRCSLRQAKEAVQSLH
ncbi:hypothetical protein [Viridibacterium curvum]|uniref:Ribosomal protein L7/L12 C-terminal domain-containing protein n=1 Tax=Viridibacterium curvum TaxID=1101404 RepID=A0ABP9QMV2_9RHOO